MPYHFSEARFGIDIHYKRSNLYLYILYIMDNYEIKKISINRFDGA